jgi:hypothetical protein
LPAPRGSAILMPAMNKLTIAAALLSLSVAAPVFACPMENHDATPRTAEKAKDAPKPTTAAKAKDAKPADAATAAKPTDKAKPADKVSQK